jgi:hypothetical protein
MKRFVTLFAALLMALPLFFGCSHESETAAPGGEVVETETVEVDAAPAGSAPAESDAPKAE